MSTATVPGFYGKVPILGDFVSRQLSRSFIEPWDAWLQSCLASSREQLGDDWIEVYLTSPIWRFVLSPSVCGGHAYAGAVMPSVDRVGRFFPLTIALALTPPRAALSMVAGGERWFENAEEQLLWALDDDSFEINAFEQRVAALVSGLPAVASDLNAINAPDDGSAWRVALNDAANPAERLPDVLAAVLSAGYGPYSVWWTVGCEHLSPSLLICSGLPQASSYAALLTGDWCRHGWHDGSAAHLGCTASSSKGDAA